MQEVIQVIIAGLIFIAVIVAGSLAQGATPPLKNSQQEMLNTKTLQKLVDDWKKQVKKK